MMFSSALAGSGGKGFASGIKIAQI